MTRILALLVAAFLFVIAAAKIAYSVTTGADDGPVTEPWSQDRMEFVAWNSEKWTATIHDGKFELVPVDTRDWSRHAKSSVAFTNWDGEAWQAKIGDGEFLLARHGNWDGPVERSEAIRYRDWSGNNQIRTVTDLQR